MNRGKSSGGPEKETRRKLRKKKHLGNGEDSMSIGKEL